jgi:hypothetical protein
MNFHICLKVLHLNGFSPHVLQKSIEVKKIVTAQDGPWFLKQRNCGDLRAHSQLSALKGVEARAEASGWDWEEGQALVTHSNLHQRNQQVG